MISHSADFRNHMNGAVQKSGYQFFQQETCVLLKKNFNHGLTRKTVETKKFKRAIITSVEYECGKLISRR